MNLEVNLGGMQLSSCEEVAGLLRLGQGVARAKTIMA